VTELQGLALTVFAAALAAIGVLSLCFARRISADRIPMQWGFDGKPTWYAPRAVGLWWSFCFALVVGGVIAFIMLTRDGNVHQNSYVLMIFSFAAVVVQAWHLRAVEKWAARR
jgi:uncharacterized membrane protein